MSGGDYIDTPRQRAAQHIWDAIPVPAALAEAAASELDASGLLVGSRNDPEQAVLDAVRNWRAKPDSSGALFRLMQETDAWLSSLPSPEDGAR